MAALAGLVPSGSADIRWNNPAGGSASIAANWFPARLPTASELWEFDTPGTYSITISNTTPASGDWYIDRGSTTRFRFTGFHDCAGDLRIGNDIVGDPSAIFNLGRFEAESIVMSQVNGSQTVLTLTESMRLESNGDCIIGNSGNALLDVAESSKVYAASFYAGRASTAVGTMLVHGFSLEGASEIGVTGPIILGESGEGVLLVTGGGFVDAEDDMTLAKNAGSIGNVLVAGSSSAFSSPSAINVSGDLRIANNTTNAPAGTSLFETEAGADVRVFGTTYIGDFNGGTGTLRINGGEFRTTSLLPSGTGTVQLRDGRLTIDGGLYPPTGGSIYVNGFDASDAPTLRFQNGVARPSGTIGLGSIAGRSGRLELLSGSTITSTGSECFMGGYVTGASGSMLISGSSFSTNIGIAVGRGSQGTLDILAGGVVVTGYATIATIAGATGTVTVSGTGSRLTSSNALAVGGSLTTPGGLGRLVVSDNADVNVNSGAPASIVVHNTGGELEVGAARVTVNHDVRLDGRLEILGGTLTARNLILADSTRIVARGVIDAGTTSPIDPDDAVLTLTGALAIGPTTLAGLGIFWTGDTVIGPHSLTLRQNTGGARLGDVTISGGSISATAPIPVFLANGDSLIGSGTVNTRLDISPGTTIISTGASGLTFTNLLTSQPGTSVAIGTRLNFSGPTSGFTGNASFNCNTFVATEATFTADSALTFGVNSASTCTFTGGRLNAGSATILFRPSGNVAGPEITDIRGGTITASQYVITSVDHTATLQGFGLINGSLYNQAIVAPAGSGADQTGTVNVAGVYSMNNFDAPGELRMDIGPAEHDRLSVTQNVNLGGTLTVNALSTPLPPGTTYTILQSTSGVITGDFLSVTLPPRCTLVRTPNTLSVFTACTSDIDADADSDSDDVFGFFQGFEGGNESGDTDQDGDTDSDDIVTFFGAFEEGC